jgi:phosphohistidine phosphatase
MRTLYLLRHAKSSWDDPALADRDRPLAKRGRKAAKRIARHLRDEGIEPDLVLCSSSVRTLQTLERIGLEGEVEDGLYGASAAELLDRLREVPSDVESVMLIGHNPGLEGLLAELSGERPDKFPTAALATLEFDGRWHLTALVKPRELP